MTKTNAIGWFDIYVRDMKRAVKFYETVLKQKLTKMSDPTEETELMAFSAKMTAYGAAGALVKSDYSKPGVGGTMVYFSVADCSEQETRVAEAGGQVIKPKFSIGEFGWVSICQDTEGNIVGFNSMT